MLAEHNRWLVGSYTKQQRDPYNQFASSLFVWSVALSGVIVLLLTLQKWTSQREDSQSKERKLDTLGFSASNCRWTLKRPLKMVAKVTLVLLVIGIIASIFISLFISKISTDNDRNNLFILNQTVVQNDHAVTLDDRFENLFWFIQISDTHFNFYNDRNRVSDLQHFCHNLVPLVSPPALVLTGDITDSRSPDPMGSDQYVQEWLAYNETRIKCMNDNPNITWLDIRGNHDNFNVYKSWNDYYRKFTVQGNLTKEGRSYRYEVKAHDGNRYSFVGVDACLIPGIKRPFNFIGKLEEDELDRVKRLKQQSADSAYTIWFGHYPTSAISNANDLRSLINGPYLCGHFHNFHGLAPKMYSTQREGYLEAELGDWKSNRMFRIGVVDGGLFTFGDFHYKLNNEDAPLIVISNPRSVLYQMESYEPFWRSAKSTHIRAVIFSKLPLTHVNACITNHPKVTKRDCLESFELKHVKGPLWVVPWSGKEYQKGLYYITITAANQHESSEVTSPFSFDQTKPQFTLSGRISLRVSFQSIGLFFFSSSLLLALAPLLCFKVFTYNDNAYFRHMFNLSRRSYFRKVLFKLYVLAHVPKLFYPLVLVPIYICCGPWLVGKFVSDDLGVVFIWGTLVNGYRLPVSFTFIFGGLFLFIFHIPFTASLACLVSSRCMKSLSEVQFSNCDTNGNGANDNAPLKSNAFCDLDVLNILFLICIIVLEAFASTVYYFAYGYLAMLTSIYAWMSVLYVILLAIALRLKKEDFCQWL